MNISKRKDEHIKYALKQDYKENDFDLIKLNHLSIPEFDLKDVSLETNFLGYKSSYPFYINAMTGGSREAKDVNEKLAYISNKYNIPIVLGSQSAALKDESLIDTYKIVREINKNGFIVANISANYNYKDALKAIEMIDADALSIHINVIQELVMEEGDRTFSHWKSNIKSIVDNITKPIIVKEVGFGMSKDTIESLINLGVSNIDVSGRGGTNFALIERERKDGKNTLFDNLGISTVDSLINAQNYNINVLASGGVRNALDIFKALTLGAKAVGLSGFFLKLTKLDYDEIDLQMEELIFDLKKIFLIYGKKNLNDF